MFIKYIVPVFLFIFVSCSSMKASNPVFEKYISRTVTPSKIEKDRDIYKFKKPLDKGKLLVLVQSQRGRGSYSPDINDILTEGLKDKSIFTEVDVDKIQHINIWDIDDKVSEAKSKNYKYLIFISYYDNNSAAFNVFHAAFKTATFNLYDLVPVFSIGIGAFNHYYAATLEATLVDLDSGLYLLNRQATSFMENFIHGGNNTKDVNTIYIRDAFRMSATELTRKLIVSLAPAVISN